MTDETRSCGSCTLCCKVLGVRGVDKPQHRWCQHCAIGEGCTIYERRPQECRDFHCMFVMAGSALPEHWLPARANMVLCSEPSVPRIEVHVDADTPDAWRQEPYYSDLKHWSAAALAAQGYIMIYLPERAIAILPHKDIDFGMLPPDSQMVHVTRMTGHGPMPDIELVMPDDPRYAPED